MIEADAPAFFALLDDTCTLLRQSPPTAREKAMFFALMCDHPFAEVKAGFMEHLKDEKVGQFMPRPAHIIAKIKGSTADDGRPGPEEAWAQVRRGNDESATLVWTDEMSQAFGVARLLLDERDDVGARMAFKEAYTRLVDDARAARRPPKWTVSLGNDATDPAARNAVLLPHIQAGRISSDLLLEHSAVKGLDGLLALPAPQGMTEEGQRTRANALEALNGMRARLVARQEAAERAEAEESAAFLRELAAKEAATAERNKHNEA